MSLPEKAVAIHPTSAEIVEWCRNYIAQVLNVPVQKIDANADFESLGLDSVVAVALVTELETWLNVDLEPATLFEYPTITSFAEYLSQR
jgi:acyl carrier protein